MRLYGLRKVPAKGCLFRARSKPSVGLRGRLLLGGGLIEDKQCIYIQLLSILRI